MTYFIAQGYSPTLGRKSENKVFTHAVIYQNSEWPTPGATFHVSLKLAQREATRMGKRPWLKVLEIVEVKAECAHTEWEHEYSDDSILGDAYYCADCNELMQVG